MTTTNADGWPTGHRAGWKAADIDLAESTHRLTAQELDVLLAMVDATKAAGLPVTAIRREHFIDPAVQPMLDRIVRTMKFGRAGLSFVKGFPVADRPIEDIWRLYWGIGCHFGEQVSQNHRGDLQGEVRVRPEIRLGRAYANPGRLPYHSDRADTLCLLSIFTARSGGENMFVSSLGVWDVVEQERPDLLPILKRGFFQYRGEEQAPGAEESTPYRVPIFGDVDGLRSAHMSGNSIIETQQKRFPDDLGPREMEALTFMREVIERPEMHVRALLEPGEAVFINNHEVLHSREAFVDHPDEDRRRLLLRMWIEGRPARPKPEAMDVMRNPSGRQGIDPQPQYA